MRALDTSTGYGWISIALHWITAIVVLVLWFIGGSIQSDLATGSSETLYLHTSIAITAYLLLWARVVWRFVKGHPAALPEQRGLFFLVGKYTHYALLVAIGLMLISGPLMAWSRGEPIHVFDWFTIPGPYGANMTIFDATHFVHVWAARVIIIGTVMHLGGVYKHAAFNQDGTFSKMLIAARDESSSAA